MLMKEGLTWLLLMFGLDHVVAEYVAVNTARCVSVVALYLLTRRGGGVQLIFECHRWKALSFANLSTGCWDNDNEKRGSGLVTYSLSWVNFFN